MQRIELTPVQKQRLQTFRSQIEPMRQNIALLEQGVHAMLATVLECNGAVDGANYSLNEEGTALVLNEAAPITAEMAVVPKTKAK